MKSKLLLLFCFLSTVIWAQDDPPVAVCMDITIQLDLSGNAMITGSDIDGGSTDDMGIASLSASPDTFTCANLGVNVVTLTVTDTIGQTDTCTATVTVEESFDTLAAICQDITIQLDSSGNASILAADIDGGSTGDGSCSTISIAASQTAFDCSNLGANTVTLTVTNGAGLTDTCPATVTVEELIEPTVAVCQDITLQIDASGMVTIPDSALDGGSTGEGSCATLTFTAAQTTFSCTDVFNPPSTDLIITGLIDGPIPVGGAVEIPDYPLSTGVEYYLVTSGYAAGDFGSFTNTITGPGTVSCPSGGGSCTITSDCNLVDDTTGAPTWVRPNSSGPNLSTLGPVSYDVYGPFTVDVAGNYTFQNLPAGWNGYLHLYSNCFDPTNQLSNLLVGANDTSAGTPKAIELFSRSFIPDLSLYGIGVANDGAGSDGQEYTFPAISVPADTFFYIASEATDFTNFFGFAPEHTSGVLDMDGDDAIELFFNGGLIDVFGDVNVSGTGTSWDYHDGWVSRKDETTADVIFNVADWFFSGANILDDATDNTNAIIPFPLATYFNTPYGVTSPLSVMLTVSNGSSSDTCMANVTIEDNIPPTAVCVDFTLQLDANGEAELINTDIDNIALASSDNCEIGPITVEPSLFTCVDVGVNTALVTVTDIYGNEDTCIATITVEDMVPPEIFCKDITVQLDLSGEAIIVAEDVDDGSTDACGIETFSVDMDMFTCANIGDNTITLTATDFNGNSATCTAVVTVEDGIAPTASCQDITVQLDASGMATITSADVDAGSSDFCTGVTTSIDVSNFDCNDLGANTVVLTVMDANGNTSTCSATVTVQDNIAPVAAAMDITVQLDGNGNASITGSDIDNGSTDNCAIASLSPSPNTFDCSDAASAVPVTLTVTDTAGNTDQAMALVTVVDSEPPVAVCQDITISIDTSGTTVITPADVDAGSSVSCGSAILSIDNDTFTCADVGTTAVVTLTVMNSGGLSTSCTSNVTVIDTTAPVAVCQDLTVQLDASGTASILPSEVDNGSTDNCDSPTLSLDISTFNCSNVGVNTVQLTVTDSNGNSASCTATVTVEDIIPPMAVCQNITVPLDATGNVTINPIDVDGGSTDACGIVSRTLDNATFDCSNLGPNSVLYTVTDANGNSASCMATITIEDNTAPNVVCQNIVVQLDASGTAFIVPSDLDGGSTDACGIDSFTISTNLFNCGSVGANNVLLTAFDSSGNNSSCTAVVTVEDNVPPTVLCQDITVQLDASGTAFITPSNIDVGSNDACGVSSITIDINTFDCDDIGPNNVVLSVTDVNGNTASCTAIVTVADTVDPIVVCPANDVVLIPNGGMYTVPDYFANGTATAQDNCTSPITDVTQNPPPGTMLDLGTYTVSVTATDSEGNSDSCNFQLIVDPQLGVSDNLNSKDFKLYPNPGTETIYLEIPENIGAVTTEIYDLNGRLIKQRTTEAGIQTLELDISELASSTYLLFIRTDQGSLTKQLIKE